MGLSCCQACAPRAASPGLRAIHARRAGTGTLPGTPALLLLVLLLVLLLLLMLILMSILMLVRPLLLVLVLLLQLLLLLLQWQRLWLLAGAGAASSPS